MKVFLTGDRSMTPIYPMQAAVEIIRAVSQGKELVTGNVAGGVEQLVRELAAMAEVGVEVLEYTALEGKPNFGLLAQFLGEPEQNDVEVVVIHADPHSSSVVKAFLAHAEDKTRLVTPADLLQ